MDTVDYPVHKILLGAGFVNTENLCNLASLVGKTFPYATLPLRFKNADGSPVRAVAMPEVNTFSASHGKPSRRRRVM